MAKKGNMKISLKRLRVIFTHRIAKKNPLSAHLLLEDEDDIDHEYESINKRRSANEESSVSRIQENESSSSGYVLPNYVSQEEVNRWKSDFYHTPSD